MKNWIDQITYEPLRHWQRFIKGFCIFMIGVGIWYSEIGFLYFGVSDRFIGNYSDPSKIIALAFLAFGTVIALIGYLQILVCRLMPSKTRLSNS